MANEIRLRSEKTICYLQQEHIAKYADVEMKSTVDGYSIKVNRIMLASLSSHFRHELLKNSLNEDDKLLMLCEFPKEILSTVEQIVSGNYFRTKTELAPNINDEINRSFGLDVNVLEPLNNFVSVKGDVKTEPPLPAQTVAKLVDMKEDVDMDDPDEVFS